MPTIGPNGIVVGIADLVVARAADKRITTFALGSCIGLTVYDPVTQIGGMLHYMLPQPTEGAAQEEKTVAMYATSGVPELLRKLEQMGCRLSRAITCVAGGAELLDGTAVFAIGRRNRSVLRKLLWKDDVSITAEDTGGRLARTMVLDLAEGLVTIKTREGTKEIYRPGMTPVTQGVSK